MEHELGVIVVPIIATKKKGIDTLKDILINNKFTYDQATENSFNFETEKQAYSFINNVLNKCTTKTKK